MLGPNSRNFSKRSLEGKSKDVNTVNVSCWIRIWYYVTVQKKNRKIVFVNAIKSTWEGVEEQFHTFSTLALVDGDDWVNVSHGRRKSEMPTT